jgi:predicted nucleotidyltransferase component of viral defense system
MIPQAYIREWSKFSPWKTNEQIEQDLIICRAIVEIFSDDWLSKKLAFRGGTALHKLYLQPQSRYSEDIDLVQITEESFGPIIDRIRERLSFLESPKVKQKESNNTLVYNFESEYPPVRTLKLKVETNCREHFTVIGLKQYPFRIQNTWFSGECEINTYSLEELLGTKLRALYQRKKGRDIYDLYIAIEKIKQLNINDVIRSYKKYMEFSVSGYPSVKEFIINLEKKMLDQNFRGDVTALLRLGEDYDIDRAYQIVKEELIEKI